MPSLNDVHQDHRTIANEALRAFKWLSDREGIIPALETSHAIAYLQQSNSGIKKGENIILCLSGRGDKDLDIIFKSESIK